MRQQWKPSNKSVNTSKTKQYNDYPQQYDDFDSSAIKKVQHPQSQSSDRKQSQSNEKNKTEVHQAKKWQVKPVKVSKSKEVQKQQFVEYYNKLEKNDLEFLRQSFSQMDQFNELYRRTFEVEEELEYGSDHSNQDEEIEEEIESLGQKEEQQEVIDEIINEEIQRTDNQIKKTEQFQPVKQFQTKQNQYIVKKARPISAKVENTIQNKVLKVSKDNKERTPSNENVYQQQKHQNQSFSIGKTSQSFDKPQSSKTTSTATTTTGLKLISKKKQNKLMPIKETKTESYNENQISKQSWPQVL